jgi:hypothetical protein
MDIHLHILRPCEVKNLPGKLNIPALRRKGKKHKRKDSAIVGWLLGMSFKSRSPPNIVTLKSEWVIDVGGVDTYHMLNFLEACALKSRREIEWKKALIYFVVRQPDTYVLYCRLSPEYTIEAVIGTFTTKLSDPKKISWTGYYRHDSSAQPEILIAILYPISGCEYLKGWKPVVHKPVTIQSDTIEESTVSEGTDSIDRDAISPPPEEDNAPPPEVHEGIPVEELKHEQRVQEDICEEMGIETDDEPVITLIPIGESQYEITSNVAVTSYTGHRRMHIHTHTLLTMRLSTTVMLHQCQQWSIYSIQDFILAWESELRHISEMQCDTWFGAGCFGSLPALQERLGIQTEHGRIDMDRIDDRPMFAITSTLCITVHETWLHIHRRVTRIMEIALTYRYRKRQHSPGMSALYNNLQVIREKYVIITGTGGKQYIIAVFCIPIQFIMLTGTIRLIRTLMAHIDNDNEAVLHSELTNRRNDPDYCLQAIMDA